jgi:hypothetical protein
VKLIFFFVAAFFAAAVPAASAAPTSAPLDAAAIDKVLTSAHAAAGGAQLDAFGAMTQAGSFVQNGGPPSSFDSVVDLRTGHSRNRLVVGPATLLQGYDGVQWTWRNGSLSIVSLPSFVADAVTQAYLNSNAYFRADQRSTVTSARADSVDGKPAYTLHVEPAGGSPADLYFDAATYRLVKIAAQTAQGLDTTTNSDFQVVSGVTVPMRSIDVDPQGTTTTTTLTSVQFAANVAPGALDRPPYTSRGTVTGTASIPFVSDIAGTMGHIVVPVSLDGKPTSLIFDSGGANFLDPGSVTRLGLKASGGVATGGAGTHEQMTAFARVSTVDFGGARLSDQNFIVTALPFAILHIRKGVSVEGLIGYEYLANFRVTIRYADHRMDVTSFDAPAPTGGVTLPFKSDGGHAYVLAEINGVSGYFLLDTGNSGGVDLNAPFVQEHHLFPNGGLIYRTPGGVGGGFEETHAAAKSFSFAGLTFHNVPITFAHVSAGFFATRGVAGNLGADVLSRFTVIFDYRAQTVTFIPNRNASLPFPSDRTGLSLDQRNTSGLEVVRVVPGSPAATAGIAAGDRITAFAGKRIADGYGGGDLLPYTRGTRPFTVTIVRAGVSRNVRLTPRYLLPPPQ